MCKARLFASVASMARQLSVAAVALAVVPAALLAQGTSATYTACYVLRSGTVYRIKAPNAPSTCTKQDHVEFSWSETGVPGPQGPQGPAGPQGPQGPAGQPGVRAYAHITASGTLDSNRSRSIVSVTQPTPGRYCVTPAAGITPDLHPAVVSQTDEMLASVAWDMEMVPSGVCAAGQYGISSFSTISGGPMSVGFTILIP